MKQEIQTNNKRKLAVNDRKPISKELERICKEFATGRNKPSQNKLRLLFSAHDLVTDELLCKPVVSQIVNNEKSAETNKLKIVKSSITKGKPVGDDELILLTSKVQRDNIKVNFLELNDKDEVIWQESATFQNCDIHKQFAIVCRTPAYKEKRIDRDVQVYVELRRLSDSKTSNRLMFTYIANKIRDRRYPSLGGFLASSMPGSNGRVVPQPAFLLPQGNTAANNVVITPTYSEQNVAQRDTVTANIIITTTYSEQDMAQRDTATHNGINTSPYSEQDVAQGDTATINGIITAPYSEQDQVMMETNNLLDDVVRNYVMDTDYEMTYESPMLDVNSTASLPAGLNSIPSLPKQAQEFPDPTLSPEDEALMKTVAWDVYSETDADIFFNNFGEHRQGTHDLIADSGNVKVQKTKENITKTKEIVKEEIVTNSEEIVTDTEKIVTNSEKIVTETDKIVTDTQDIVTDTQEIVADTQEMMTHSEEIVTNTQEIVSENPDKTIDSNDGDKDQEKVVEMLEESIEEEAFEFDIEEQEDNTAKDSTVQMVNKKTRRRSEEMVVGDSNSGHVLMSKLIPQFCSLIIENVNNANDLEIKEKLHEIFQVRFASGETFLQWAVDTKKYANVEVIVKFLSRYKMYEYLNAQDNEGQTLLHYAVIRNISNMIDYFVSHGCSPIIVDDLGNNPLHIAVLHNKCVKELVEAIIKYTVEFDFDAKNTDGHSPIYLACINLNLEALRAMTSVTSSLGHTDTVVPRHTTDHKGIRTPLHLAAFTHNLDVFDGLMKTGWMYMSNIDQVDDRGYTALQILCAGQRREHTLKIATMLLDRGADPAFKCGSRQSALELCYDKQELCDLLYKYVDGVEVKLEDDVKSEVTDYDTAEEENNRENPSELEGLSAYKKPVSVILDQSCKWRTLATKLGMEDLINMLSEESSPTSALFDHIKVVDPTVTSPAIAKILLEMNEKEAGQIILDFVDV